MEQLFNIKVDSLGKATSTSYSPPMDPLLDLVVPNELVRRFSLELESQTSGDEPPNELTLAVIDERKREDEKQKQLREWRKCFEPQPISE